jgi:hypothetical protein
MVYMMMRIGMCNHCESVYLTKSLKMLIKVLHWLMHRTTNFFFQWSHSTFWCAPVTVNLNAAAAYSIRFSLMFSQCLWQSVILPCACYLTILGKKATHFQVQFTNLNFHLVFWGLLIAWWRWVHSQSQIFTCALRFAANYPAANFHQQVDGVCSESSNPEGIAVYFHYFFLKCSSW